MSLKDAAKEVIQNKLTNLGDTDGIVAIDTERNMIMAFNTPGMYCATMNDQGELYVGMYNT